MQLDGDFLVLGDEDNGQVEFEESGESRQTLRGGETIEVGDFGLAQHMQPPGHEPAGVTGQCKPRRSDLRIGNGSVQSYFAGHRDQLERVPPP